jgi:hypothetical protein
LTIEIARVLMLYLYGFPKFCKTIFVNLAQIATAARTLMPAGARLRLRAAGCAAPTRRATITDARVAEHSRRDCDSRWTMRHKQIRRVKWISHRDV